MLWSQKGLIITVIRGSGLLESADSWDRVLPALITYGLAATGPLEARRYGGDFKKDDRSETGGGDGAG
jgi:hypothetical protein